MIVLVVTLLSLLIGAVAFVLTDGASPEASPLVAVLAAIATALLLHMQMPLLQRWFRRPEAVVPPQARELRAEVAVPAVTTRPTRETLGSLPPDLEGPPPVWDGGFAAPAEAPSASLPAWPPAAAAPVPVPATKPTMKKTLRDPSQLPIDLDQDR